MDGPSWVYPTNSLVECPIPHVYGNHMYMIPEVIWLLIDTSFYSLNWTKTVRREKVMIRRSSNQAPHYLCFVIQIYLFDMLIE